MSVGTALAYSLRPGILFPLLLLLASCGLAGLFLSKGAVRAFWITAGLGFGALGLWNMACTLPENVPGHYIHRAKDTPGVLHIRILEERRHSSHAFRYFGEVTAVGSRQASGKILLEIAATDGPPSIHAGYQVRVGGTPEAIPPPLNPGQFDYASYLKGLGIERRLRIREGAVLGIKKGSSGISGHLKKLRQGLLLTLGESGLPSEELGIARALLLGDRTQIDREVHSGYRKAGALHLLAVSGLHVGILAGFLSMVLMPLRRLPNGKGAYLILISLLLWCYAFLAGFSPSTVRAVILFSLLVYARFMERPGDTLHLLLLCWMAMLVLIEPLWLLQAGFQLSFAAVAGIVVFYPALYALWPWKQPIWGNPGKLLCVSLAAQLATLPLTLYYFHQFPGLFLLTNLVLVPGIGLVLIYGFLLLLLGSLSSLPPVMTEGYHLVLKLMNGFVYWVGSQDAFHLEGIRWGREELVLGGTAVLLAGAYLRTRKKFLISAVFIVLSGMQIWAITGILRASGTSVMLVPHKVGRSGVWVLQGTQLQVLSRDPASLAPLVSDARNIWRIDRIATSTLQNHYRIGPYRLRVIDSSGVYAPVEPHPDYLLLSGSPKVHLGRLLERLSPGAVIADGSNYHSLLPHWEKSCRGLGIPFHATAYQGAFITPLQGPSSAADTGLSPKSDRAP